MVENLSLSAGDTGLIPDPGRFHKSQSNGPVYRNTELEPELVLCYGKPPQRGPHTQLEKAFAEVKTRVAKKTPQKLMSEGLTIFDLKFADY